MTYYWRTRVYFVLSGIALAIYWLSSLATLAPWHEGVGAFLMVALGSGMLFRVLARRRCRTSPLFLYPLSLLLLGKSLPVAIAEGNCEPVVSAIALGGVFLLSNYLDTNRHGHKEGTLEDIY